MPAIKMRTQTRKPVDRGRVRNSITVESTRARVTTRKTRKATGSTALCDAAMKRPTMLVHVPRSPFQPTAALYTKLPAMASALEAMLRHYHATLREQPGKLAPHSIAVHEDRCAFGVVLWPRANEGVDLEEMRDAVSERDEQCGCTPLILYPGACA